AQRSSAQGESAPKVRARAVADGNPVNIPEPPTGAMWGRRRLCEPAVGLAGEACRWISLGNPGGRYHRGAGPRGLCPRKSRIPCFQEKPLSFSPLGPYRKPTQVGRMKILRRLRELRRRNSANAHSNFGRGGASGG